MILTGPGQLRRRAFTLTEMLFVLVLIGVAGLMLSRLFTSSMRVIASAPKSQEQHAAIDRMCDVLRHNVWGAANIDVADPFTVNLTQTDGAIVRLRLHGSEVFRSSDDGKSETRFTTTVPLRAAREGSWLVLKCDTPGDELRFASQVLALREGAR